MEAPAQRPYVGDIWEMRVEILNEREGLAFYRVLEPDRKPQWTVRRLPVHTLRACFDVHGCHGLRRVRIVSCEPERITYERDGSVPGSDRNAIPLPLFVAHYSPWDGSRTANSGRHR